jgi:hypothetical protein
LFTTRPGTVIRRRNIDVQIFSNLPSQFINFGLHLLNSVQVLLALSVFYKLRQRNSRSKNPDLGQDIPGANLGALLDELLKASGDQWDKLTP